jgi:predicted Holliday junction resolvase-like endonuclease
MIEIIIVAIIFLVGIIIAYYIGYKFGAFRKNKFWEEQIPGHRKDAILRSRSVLGGHFSEQLAPYLPDFEYLPTECRFIGKPIDFIVFKGMDDKKIDELIFVEVKSGNAKLTSQEKNLKEAIEKKKVKWVEYRIPEDLTKKGNIEDKIKDIFDGK